MQTLPLLLQLLGCTYDEGLEIRNLQGTVVVPRAAATRDIPDESGALVSVTDVRLIGPVYLGLFPGMLGENEFTSYPHPAVGPQYLADTPGDTYPYGGTTVGDFRFPCFESLVCKLTSGRFVDYDSILSWFNDTVGDPVVDAKADPVTTGEFLEQTCFDLLEVVTTEEVRITAFEDTNGDEKIDAMDLDFVENADGDFEADFTIWQQEMFYDIDDSGADPAGMQLWGFMDGPSSNSYTFATCNGDSAGLFIGEYNMEFYGGVVQTNTLNLPSQYIVSGDHDWVATEGFEWSNWEDRPAVLLDFEVL